jgi:hypothetical protein
MGKKIFDMGRSLGKNTLVVKTLNETRAELGLDPADCGGEVVLPLDVPKPNFVFTFEGLDVERFREIWDRAVGEAAGRMFAIHTDTNKVPEIPEIPKADLPYGNLNRIPKADLPYGNLNRRKLRIRR